MDLKLIATEFEQMLNYRHTFVLIHKKSIKVINVLFFDDNLHHLLAFQHFDDRPNLKNYKRNDLLEDILDEKLNERTVTSSSSYEEYEERINNIKYLKSMFENDKSIFSFNKYDNGSKIDAEYVMTCESPISDCVYNFLSCEEADLHIFICKSSFPKTDKNTIKTGKKYKIMYHEYYNYSSSLNTVLVDRFKNSKLGYPDIDLFNNKEKYLNKIDDYRKNILEN